MSLPTYNVYYVAPYTIALFSKLMKDHRRIVGVTNNNNHFTINRLSLYHNLYRFVHDTNNLSQKNLTSYDIGTQP